METENQAHEASFCGAKKRSGGHCQAQAGAGTDHKGTGKCRHHGGRSTGPRNQAGNKNAVTTGRYESILFDSLDEDERELADIVARRQKLDILNDRIAIATVRERRMLRRIAALSAIPGGMALVEETTETLLAETGEQPEFSDREASELDADDPRIAAWGEQPDGNTVTKRKEKRTGTLGQIQSIESDLTAVQTLIARLVTDKLRVETQGASTGDDDRDFDGSLFEGGEDGRLTG